MRLVEAVAMNTPDDLSQYYAELLEGIYDCADRMVLNAYFPLGQTGVACEVGGDVCVVTITIWMITTCVRWRVRFRVDCMRTATSTKFPSSKLELTSASTYWQNRIYPTIRGFEGCSW
jgi:hypothetical protein